MDINTPLYKKLYFSGTPKRILCLDGGGVRGILTLGMLKKLEAIAREKSGNKDLVLGDYYDLITGTSTGAIIACGLAIGKSVDEIIALYKELGKKIFEEGRRWKILNRDWTTLRAIFKENYSSTNFESYLQKVFGNITIGDQQNMRCGLAIHTKRADTYSLWSVANHPEGRYYEANKHLKLWELCRASSAAPYYFKPKKLSLKTRKGDSFSATFIDGGVSLANNPTWESFLLSIFPTFGYSWPKGKDNMLITSLGTGNGQKKDDADKLEQLRAIMWAPKLSDLFMVDALETNQILMEAFGLNAGSSFSVNSQYEHPESIGLLAPQDRLFTFVRYNVSLTEQGFKDIGMNLNSKTIDSMKEMDHAENMDLLLETGEKFAAKNINAIL